MSSRRARAAAAAWCSPDEQCLLECVQWGGWAAAAGAHHGRQAVGEALPRRKDLEAMCELEKVWVAAEDAAVGMNFLKVRWEQLELEGP